MFGEPDGIIAGLVHDGESLQRRFVNRIERHGPVAPAEELQNADFHVSPPVTVRSGRMVGDFCRVVQDPGDHRPPPSRETLENGTVDAGESHCRTRSWRKPDVDRRQRLVSIVRGIALDEILQWFKAADPQVAV